LIDLQTNHIACWDFLLGKLSNSDLRLTRKQIKSDTPRVLTISVTICLMNYFKSDAAISLKAMAGTSLVR